MALARRAQMAATARFERVLLLLAVLRESDLGTASSKCFATNVQSDVHLEVPGVPDGAVAKSKRGGQ
eukprot:15456084-Alexandrium_andersonii.AAC.1